MPYQHPFTKNSADVILRSSDGDDFKVHKLILSEASCVFESMFSLPQPSDTSERAISESADAPKGCGLGEKQLAIVEVPESSRTLDLLLRYCYPMSRPPLTNLQELIPLLESMKKYDMGELVEDVRCELLKDRFNQTLEDAFAVYTAVWRLDIKEYLEITARAIFRFRLPSFASPILQSTPPAAIFALMEFRSRCIEAALDYLTNPSGWRLCKIVRWTGTEHEDSRETRVEEPSYDDDGYGKSSWTVLPYGCRRCVWCASKYTEHDFPQEAHLLQLDAEDARDELLELVRERPSGLALREGGALRKQLYDDRDEETLLNYRYCSPKCSRCIVDGAESVSQVLQHLGTDLDAVLRSVSTLQCLRLEARRDNWSFIGSI